MSSLSPALVSDDPGAQARSVTLDRAAAEIVVAPASRAPSLHNTQPWQWRLADGALDLPADRSRQLHVADPDGLSLLISCGAAAELTQLALAALGWAADTILLPGGGDPDLLARFHVRSRREPDPVAARDIAAAGRRRSERRVFGSRPVLSQAIEALRVAAQASGVFADFASSEEESVRGKPDAEPAALTAKRRPVDDVRTITPAAAAGQIGRLDSSQLSTRITGSRPSQVRRRLRRPGGVPRVVLMALVAYPAGYSLPSTRDRLTGTQPTRQRRPGAL